jgi:AcrR family transcriptional regulator
MLLTDGRSEGIRHPAGPLAGSSRLAMLHEHSVEHTTLALVAAAADVPVGNIYYYFKSKDELLSAVIGAYSNDFVMLDAILARHRTPKARLKALIRTWTAAREASAVLAHLISLAQDQFEQQPA